MSSTMADDDRSQEKKNGGASGIDRRHSERQEHRVPSLATSKKQGSTVAKVHAALCTETPEAIPKTIGTSDAEAKSAETVNAEIDGAQSIKSYMSPQRFFPLERSYSEMSIERMDSGQFEKYEQTNEEKEKGFNESASGGLVTIKNDINDEDEDDDDDEKDVDDQDKRSFVEDKVRYMFGLPSNERIQAEFPCYLVRLVTLPGWMYVTDSSVCFFASLPEKEKGPQKTGYLSKKNHRASPRSYRYYFELRNHVLSWYESAEEKYAPLDSIDLKQVIDIRASRTRRNGFQITTSHSKWNLTADSEVSQKEWLDELRRSAFMARNAGNSVRIVLPFNKMAQVNKAVAFSFAEYLRIRIADASEFDGQDEYYFAFFPDIDAAYHKIATMHCEGQSHSDYCERSDTLKSSEDGSVDVSAFESSDNVFGNTSSGVSAMLVGAITHPKATFWDGSKRERQRQTPTITTEAMNDAPHAKSPASSIVPSDSISDRHNDTLTAPSDEKSKRHSWSFGWLSQQQQSIKSVPTSPVSTPSINTNQSEHLLSVAADQTKEAPKKVGRFRSSSTASIKQLARQSLGLSAAQTSKEQPPNEPSIDDSSLDDEKKSKHDRTGSLSGIIKQARKQVSSSGPSEDHQDTKASELPPLPKPAKQVSTSWWISKTLHDSLLQQENLKGDDVSATADDKQDLKRQKSLSDELRKYFPMLGDAENVIALFPSSLWRTLPYPGRLYFTDNYICFHSKVLAGRQRLIIPLGDITSVRRLKSRGYYLLHGIGLVAKDLQEEIYFEFSAVTARDRCYALFYLLTGDYGSPEKRKEVDAASVSVGLSNILASSTEHVLPPMEYEGPPLLSSIPTVEPATQTTAPKSLHITCLTIGSRGDVQPYIALCKQLQKEGHRCRIASHGEYQKWVEEHGIEFRSIGGDPGELMKLCIDNGFLSYSFIKDGMKFFYTWFEALLKTAWEACQGTDVLIESPSAMVGIHMAEKLEIPYFRSMPFPWTRTTRFSHPFATQNYTRGRLLYNDMTYVMIDTALWTGTSKYINRFRRQTLQLPATSVERLELWRVPYIYSFSPTVLPPPKDWPDYVHVTGYWFLDNPHMNWKPDDSFVKFLEAKDERPIIYIGFGSIIVPDPEAMSAVIIEAVQQAGVRAIICKGWSSRMKGDSATDVESSKMLNRYPGTIYSLDAVPHDWLFPRIHGVVHHGGAGTTAAGLRAGLPTIIKPFFGDQRFWGQRVEELGVGVCISKLTVAKLAEALKTISRNNAIISKAHALGEAIRKENGVKTAVDCIYRDLNYARRTRQKVSESEGGSKMSLLPTNWWGTAGQSTGDNISESDDVANSTEIKAH